MQDLFNQRGLIQKHHQRIVLMKIFVVFCFSVLCSRLWFLQIRKGNILLEYSNKNRLRKKLIKAPRGIIYDRNGEVLVDNRPRFDVQIIPQYLENNAVVFEKLAQILNLKPSEIKKILKKYAHYPKFQGITIKKNISREELAKIEARHLDLSGVEVKPRILRHYTSEDLFAHTIGYVSEISRSKIKAYTERDNINYKPGDAIGNGGIEQHFDRVLRGEDGHEYIQVDALGRQIHYDRNENIFEDIVDEVEFPGRNIHLTLDQRLQEVSAKLMEGLVGGVVALDVKNGDILSLYSSPSFNPNLFSRGIKRFEWSSIINNSEKPLLNRVIQTHYSPGSTFKPVTAFALLGEGVIDSKKTIFCPGHIDYGNRRYHCWKKKGHGYVNLRKALRESCNVYFQKFVQEIGIDKLAKYARDFSLGSKIGITLPGEVNGLIPDEEWKFKRFKRKWQGGETLSCAIGQSYVLESPLQMAVSYMKIANKGIIYQPRMIREIRDYQDRLVQDFPIKPIVDQNPISDEEYEEVIKGLTDVVNHPKGTASFLKSKTVSIAGKTGTSQVVRQKAENVYIKCEKLPLKFRHHGLFVGFAPVEDPEIVVSVIVEHGCHGNTAAGPIAKGLIEKYIELKEKNYAESNQEGPQGV